MADKGVQALDVPLYLGKHFGDIVHSGILTKHQIIEGNEMQWEIEVRYPFREDSWPNLLDKISCKMSFKVDRHSRKEATGAK